MESWRPIARFAAAASPSLGAARRQRVAYLLTAMAYFGGKRRLPGLLFYQNQACDFASGIQFQPQAFDFGLRQGFLEDDGEGIAAENRRLSPLQHRASLRRPARSQWLPVGIEHEDAILLVAHGHKISSPLAG